MPRANGDVVVLEVRGTHAAAQGATVAGVSTSPRSCCRCSQVNGGPALEGVAMPDLCEPLVDDVLQVREGVVSPETMCVQAWYCHTQHPSPTHCHVHLPTSLYVRVCLCLHGVPPTRFPARALKHKTAPLQTHDWGSLC
jgi:hypothetical protein